MKIICVSDIHLSAFSYDPIIDGIPERLFTFKNVSKNILEYARDNDISSVCILGDIFHTKSVIHSAAMSIFLDFIRENRDINFILIDGNHDCSSKSGNGVSALKSCDEESNVITIHEPSLIENMWMVPWNSDMIDAIKNPPKEAEYLFSHLGVSEAKFNSGISIVSDIGVKDLRQYKHVYLGHYHSKQTVGNMTYIGSMFQLDWGEKNEEKRFIVFDSETGETQSIPTEGYKKYIEFDLTNENKNLTFDKCKELKEAGHLVKLNLTEKIDINEIPEGVRFVDKTEKDMTKRGVTSSMSENDRFVKYLELKDISESDRDSYMIEIMDAISSINSTKGV
jgi:DNA repair exonuclease SbcCD nuclease subunit